MYMNKTIRFVSLLLAVAMLFSLAACMGRNETWAVEVDGEQIPIGVYLYYQFNAYQEASSLAADTKTPLLKQKIEEQDAAVWIHQKTIDYCRKKIATEREFARLEMTLSDTDKTYIDSMTTYIMSMYGEIFAENGVGEESVRLACTTDQMTSNLFYKYYGADGLEPVSETALKDYYTQNYAIANMFGTSIAGMSEEGAQKARDAAKAASDDLKAGKGVAETARKMTLAINPDAEVDETADDSAYLSTINKDDSGYPEAFRTEVFQATVGTATVYDKDNYLLVYVRKDAAAETEVFEGLKNSILQSIKGDEFSAKLSEMANALTVNENSSAVRFYSVQKVKDFE